MRLSDCRSYELLPRFAQNEFMASLCGAIDEVVKHLASRCNALPCETSADALAACRDDELAQIAEDLGVIPYYPELTRSTRENIILQDSLWTRKAGTCEALRVMVNAVFETDATSIEDDLDEDYHYRVSVGDNFAFSTEIGFRRFNECLEALGHTTTIPDGITFYYDGTFETAAGAASGDVLVLYDTDCLCEYPDISEPVGMTYGLMGSSSDSETGVMEQGATGYPSLIHGGLIDVGLGDYGVM